MADKGQYEEDPQSILAGRKRRPYVYGPLTGFLSCASVWFAFQYVTDKALCVQSRLPSTGTIDEKVIHLAEQACKEVIHSGDIMGALGYGALAGWCAMVTLADLLPRYMTEIQIVKKISRDYDPH